VTIVGDLLLDRDVEGDVRRLAPDAPVPVVDQRRTVTRPGGAGLAATLTAAGGHAVRLVTALGRDGASDELRAALAGAVEVIDLGHAGATPEKVRIRAQGRVLLRLDRGGDGPAVGGISGAARGAIASADVLLVADYGRGVADQPEVREAIGRAAAAGTPVVWDPHPRGVGPVPGVTLATPNATEASAFAGRTERARREGWVAAATADAELLLWRWSARWVCVTCDAAGAVLLGADGPPQALPAAAVPVGDPCGAGDRFASCAAELLGAGRSVGEAVTAAVAVASAFVAGGGAATLSPVAPPAAQPSGAGETTDARALVARLRARGATVVATGGCFDLLHPGHVRTLQAARALGDALVVCLNSDASIRRLKGSRRPVVGEEDRAAVLRSLGCVDAIAVFDEDTPARVLAELRPDVWCKGGDYAGAELPEAALLAEWGGRVVILPLLAGRSTTRLIQEASLHAV
jgi:rfaE bifunctional protein nucleotidyltransferase chain/domain/rfaE bifunctional protein kinase chain/domain